MTKIITELTKELKHADLHFCRWGLNGSAHPFSSLRNI